MTNRKAASSTFALAALALVACASAPPSEDLGVPAATPEAVVPPAEATSPATSPPERKTGALLFAAGAPIAGVAYESGAATGTTDASGAFTYEAGTPVRFRIGDVVIGTSQGADVVTPYQLAGSAKCEDTSAVKSLVALLEALDEDASGGIAVKNGPGTTPDELVLAAGKTMPAPDEALRVFVTAFDGEAWTATNKDTFSLTKAVLRGQGVATDGTSWFFSGLTGLEKVDAQLSTIASNALAIPLPLAIAGSDHIGDIDFYNGTLYAPIEDKKYESPKVVLFDPATLTSGQVFDVAWDLQTKGVPWIAVDGPAGVAYMAEWDPTPVIHVYALATMTFLRDVPLSRTLGRIQGAKVHRGQLYAAMDDAQKSIVKIHLATGTVLDLFAIGEAGIEQEGIAMLARADGTLMHTLNVTAARTGVELRHHTISRAPLRWRACP